MWYLAMAGIRDFAVTFLEPVTSVGEVMNLISENLFLHELFGQYCDECHGLC